MITTQDMLALYDHNHEMQKWMCEQVVIEITSVSLLHMVVSFLSDEQCRLQLLRDSVGVGDIDGFDYNCLSESLLYFLLHNQMIKRPNVDGNVSQWKHAACDDVKTKGWSHVDERLWPMQRDEHNRICDVYKNQHVFAYLNHYTHSVHVSSYLLKHFGIDEVDISRGIRIIVHCLFDSVLLNADAAEYMPSIICRGTTASIPPV